ncbi:MAG TPA: hypothetical protein VL576_02730 [Candidatus Paceibacterota bacterium]|jgi:hypothetical protein|nr:hypothetical protein [Candidatus Paceibacterota bacterium]
MKKILILTFNGQTQTVADSLKKKNAEVFKDLTVLSYGYDDVHEWIRKERPEIIILDKGLGNRDLQKINMEIGDTIGIYDVACSLFLVDSPAHISGVINVETIEDAVEF